MLSIIRSRDMIKVYPLDSRKILKILMLILFVSVSDLLFGCATSGVAKIKTLDGGNLQIVSYPGDMRGAYLFKRSGDYVVCSEPSPDIASKTVSEIASNLRLTAAERVNVDAGAVAKLSSDVVALAGRTQIVLVARDMLYSMCLDPQIIPS